MLAITFLPRYESVSVTLCFAWCEIAPPRRLVLLWGGERKTKKGIHFAVTSMPVTLVLTLQPLFLPCL